MTKKPPLWADLLLTLWVLVVAVFFFGVYFVPAVGLYTDSVGAAFYTLMVLAAAVTLAFKYLRRNDAPVQPPGSLSSRAGDVKSPAGQSVCASHKGEGGRADLLSEGHMPSPIGGFTPPEQTLNGPAEKKDTRKPKRKIR